MKAILSIMLATCILISSNGYAFSVKDNTFDTAKPKAILAKTNSWPRPPSALPDIISKHAYTGKEQLQYTSKQLEKARKAGIHAPAFPKELPHVWKGHTFEKCSYCKKLAFQRREYIPLLEVYNYRLKKAILPETLSVEELAAYRLMDEVALGTVELKYDGKNSLRNIKKVAELFDEDFKLIEVNETNKIVTIEHYAPFQYLIKREIFIDSLTRDEKNTYYDMQITKYGSVEIECYSQTEFAIVMKIAETLDKEFQVLDVDKEKYLIRITHDRLNLS